MRRRAHDARALIDPNPASPGFLFNDGGGGGIRTPGKREPTSDFKSGALNHSATPPKLKIQIGDVGVQVNGANDDFLIRSEQIVFGHTLAETCR